MPRHIWLYIVYGSPLLLFFVTLVAMNMALEMSLVWSFVIAAGMGLSEFFILRTVFTRIFPPQ